MSGCVRNTGIGNSGEVLAIVCENNDGGRIDGESLRQRQLCIRSQYTCDPTIGKLVLCAAGGMGFGALNEVIEFIAVLTIPNTNVGGYENTAWDMVSNLVGSVIAAVVIRVTTSPEREPAP